MKFKLIHGNTVLQIWDFTTTEISGRVLQEEVGEYLNITTSSFYLSRNGRLFQNDSIIDNIGGSVNVFPRVLGGKGGFGSMLRAIGAQIEKTTNRDACRDLSGRRLRDINEEQRLKRWFAKQNERDEEKQELKKQKLARMRRICEGPPLPKTEDREYNQQRADMAESVFEAVDKGFEASTSSSSKPSTSSAAAASASSCTSSDCSNSETEVSKRIESSNSDESGKPKEAKEKDGRKIKKTMFDEDLDSDVSSSDSDDEVPAKKSKVA